MAKRAIPKLTGTPTFVSGKSGPDLAFGTASGLLVFKLVVI